MDGSNLVAKNLGPSGSTSPGAQCARHNAPVNTSERNEDPGWFSPKSFLWMLVPVVGMRLALRQADNPLRLLRAIFTSFAMAIGFIGLVVLFLNAGEPTTAEGGSPIIVAAGVAGFGVSSLLAPRVLARPLDCSSTTALVESFRTRFFLRVAFAESAALVGFVGFFLALQWWMYPLGASFAALGFVRLAPTRRNLHQDQQTLNAAGCEVDLLRALTG